MAGTKIILDDSQFTPVAIQAARALYDLADADDEVTQALRASGIEKAKAINLIGAAVEQAIKDSAKYNSELKKEKNELDKSKESTDKKTESTKKLTLERRKLLRQFVEQKQAMKDEISNTTILGTNLGQLQRMYNSVTTVGRTWIKVLGATRVAIMATGIGALLIAVSSLISYFTKTVEGSDMLNRKLAALKSIMGNLTDVASDIGETLVMVFTKPREAAERFFNFIKNPIKAIREEVKEMVEDFKIAEQIEGEYQRIRDAQRELNEEVAQGRAEVEKQKFIAEDVTKTYDERRKAAESAFDLEQRLMNQQIKLQKDLIAAKTTELSLSESSNEELNELSQMRIDLSRLENESTTRQIELNNKVNALSQEEIRLAEEKRRKYEELQQKLIDLRKSYDDQMNAANQMLLDDEIARASDELDKLHLQRVKLIGEMQLAIEDYRESQSEALKLGAIDEAQVSEGADKIVRLYRNRLLDIEEAIKATFAVDKLVPKEFFNFSEALADILNSDDNFRANGDTIAEALTDNLNASLEKRMKSAADKVLESVKGDAGVTAKEAGYTFGELIKDGIGDALIDLDKVVNGDIYRSFQTVFQGVTDAFLSGIDLQIAKLDDLISAHDEKISELEEQYDKEKEFKDEGLAYNLETLDRQIEEEKARRETAIKEKEQLERKAQQAALINDAIQQSSSLVTASAQIFKAFSSIPFVGTALAIAAVATMFGAFAKTKIDAAKATKLYRGHERIGDTFVGNKSDRSGDGYGIYDMQTGQDTGTRIGGDEPIINAKVGAANRAAFKDMNARPDLWAKIDIKKLALSKLPSHTMIQTFDISSQSDQTKDKGAEIAIREMLSYMKSKKDVSFFEKGGKIYRAERSGRVEKVTATNYT